MSGDPSGLFVLFFVVAICLAIGNFILRARYGVPYSQRRYWNRPWGPGGPWNQGPMPPNQPWNPMSGPPYGPQMPGPDPGWQSQPDPFASPDCGPGPAPGGFDPGAMGGGFAPSCDPGPSAGFSGGDPGGGTSGSIPS